MAPLILFDGSCGLCNGWVDFVLRFDSRKQFLFSPLQSPRGMSLIEQHGLPPGDRSSIVLVTDRGVMRESAAILQILRYLGLPWSLAYGAMLIPRPIRDAAYRFVAAHRYQWFGHAETCRLPTPEERTRFV